MDFPQVWRYFPPSLAQWEDGHGKGDSVLRPGQLSLQGEVGCFASARQGDPVPERSEEVGLRSFTGRVAASLDSPKERRRRRGLVEDCEVITASTSGIFKCRGVLMSASVLRPGVFRHWLQCPICGRQSFNCIDRVRLWYLHVPNAITWSTKARLKKPTQGGHLPGRLSQPSEICALTWMSSPLSIMRALTPALASVK